MSPENLPDNSEAIRKISYLVAVGVSVVVCVDQIMAVILVVVLAVLFGSMCQCDSR